MILYGKNPLKETDPKKIKKVYINKNLANNEILDYLMKQKIRFELVDNKILDRFTHENHQGLVFDVYDYEYYTMESVTEDFVVVLDHIEDPHNLGAIIRSCECAGIKSIIIPKDRACPINETVMKISSGALNNVKVILVSNLVQAIKKLKADNYFVYGADMVGDDYRKLDYSGKKCLVIGNEGKGISELVKKECDFITSIPMKGEINSLNASVAAGIIIFRMIGE